MLIQALWDNYANLPIRKLPKSAFLKPQLNCFFKIENPFHADRHFNKLLTQWFDLRVKTQTVDKHDCHLISTNQPLRFTEWQNYVYYSWIIFNLLVLFLHMSLSVFLMSCSYGCSSIRKSSHPKKQVYLGWIVAFKMYDRWQIVNRV